MSPLRRQLTIDARFDIFAFYVKHRHTYGESVWNDFIIKGWDEDVTFTTHTTVNDLYYLGCGEQIPARTEIPHWLLAGANRIWNGWFRIPNVTTTLLTDVIEPTTALERRYGRKVAQLPNYLTPSDLKRS